MKVRTVMGVEGMCLTPSCDTGMLPDRASLRSPLTFGMSCDWERHCRQQSSDAAMSVFSSCVVQFKAIFNSRSGNGYVNNSGRLMYESLSVANIYIKCYPPNEMVDF